MEVLQTVLPVLLMIGIGMLCRRKNLISREGVNALKSTVVNITLPAVLLKAFATTRYTFMAGSKMMGRILPRSTFPSVRMLSSAWEQTISPIR